MRQYPTPIRLGSSRRTAFSNTSTVFPGHTRCVTKSTPLHFGIDTIYLLSAEV